MKRPIRSIIAIASFVAAAESIYHSQFLAFFSIVGLLWIYGDALYESSRKR